MDILETAILHRARSALDMLSSEGHTVRTRAKAFHEIARSIAGARVTAHATEALRSSPNALVAKAVSHGLGDSMWQGGDARALAVSYLATIEEFSLLDQIKKYCRLLPDGNRRILVASDAVGNVVREGDPKPLKNLELGLADVEPTKAAAIVVLSRELVEAIDGTALFERELKSAVLRACNRSILGVVAEDATAVSSTGDGPLADLRAGLQAAGPSNGFVVAMPAGDVAALATAESNRGGMGVRGGTFVPGIDIVAVDDLEALHVIPASRLALWDGGLQVRSAGDASIDMRDTPSGPAEHVSLWQSGLVALLVERRWHLAAGAAQCVIVGA